MQSSPSGTDLSGLFKGPGRALVRRPGDYELIGCLHIYLLVCLFVCVFVCVSVSACVSLTSYACLYVSCVGLYVSGCVFPSVCVSVCVIVGGLCLCDCVSENVFVCVCLCPCTVGGASLGLTLRGRGLPVHVHTPVACMDQCYPAECSLVVGFIHSMKHHHTAFRPACVERRDRGILAGK